MKILMTGATGLIGKSLGQKLVEQGHEICVVSRNKKKAEQELPFPADVIEADLMAEALPVSAFKNIEAVVHLLGESVDGRWTQGKKTKILDSRKISSENILKNLPATVRTVVSASAQGIYGDRGDELLTEVSQSGTGFLAEVCEAWERPFRKLGQRTMIVRIGLVLNSQGGALEKLISLFQKNLGAPLGSGEQWMSWISLEDLTSVFIEALTNEQYQGVINAVQPTPVQNKMFTQCLCQALGAMQLVAVPKFVLKTLWGEMSSLVLASQKVDCAFLKKHRFKFADADLKTFFQKELQDFHLGQRLFVAEQFVPAKVEKVFEFFADAENLEKITPPLLRFEIKKMSTESIQKNTEILYKLNIRGVPARWLTLIESWDPPNRFVDTQLKGPYQKWHHTHSFKSFAGGTLMRDEVRYRLPLGFFGRLTAGAFVQSDVDRIFDYRRHFIANQKF